MQLNQDVYRGFADPEEFFDFIFDCSDCDVSLEYASESSMLVHSMLNRMSSKRLKAMSHGAECNTNMEHGTV